MDSSMRSWVCGVGVGAGLVFLLDPTGGARRRALIRDKFVRASRKTRHAVDTTGRDLGNRDETRILRVGKQFLRTSVAGSLLGRQLRPAEQRRPGPDLNL